MTNSPIQAFSVKLPIGCKTLSEASNWDCYCLQLMARRIWLLESFLRTNFKCADEDSVSLICIQTHLKLRNFQSDFDKK